jgi:hypothetical protein
LCEGEGASEENTGTVSEAKRIISVYIRILIVIPRNNMGFQRLLHTETGRIIISIVLGLGIASLFRKVCKDRSCISFRAPPLKDLEKDTYKLDDKCYEYKTKAVKCEAGKKEVKLR